MTGVPTPSPTVGASLQSLFAPDGICYGCGPMNTRGLGLRSHVADGDVVATWQPQEHHAAFPGILCGGVIGTLIDCHSAAALAHAVRDVEGAWPWAESPGWATAAYSVRLQRPTALGCPVRLVARTVSIEMDDATVVVELHSDGKQRATGEVSWSRLRTRGPLSTAHQRPLQGDPT